MISPWYCAIVNNNVLPILLQCFRNIILHRCHSISLYFTIMFSCDIIIIPPYYIFALNYTNVLLYRNIPQYYVQFTKYKIIELIYYRLLRI